jgi:hypothetical protein
MAYLRWQPIVFARSSRIAVRFFLLDFAYRALSELRCSPSISLTGVFPSLGNISYEAPNAPR